MTTTERMQRARAAQSAVARVLMGNRQAVMFLNGGKVAITATRPRVKGRVPTRQDRIDIVLTIARPNSKVDAQLKRAKRMGNGNYKALLAEGITR